MDATLLQAVEAKVIEIKDRWKRFLVRDQAAIVKFMVMVLDELILFVETFAVPGADKKAAVIWAVNEIYDIIVPELLPFYVKPFSGRIKIFVVNVVVDVILEFIVDKYQTGAWQAQNKVW